MIATGPISFKCDGFRLAGSSVRLRNIGRNDSIMSLNSIKICDIDNQLNGIKDISNNDINNVTLTKNSVLDNANTTARRRWKILAKAIRQNSNEENIQPNNKMKSATATNLLHSNDHLMNGIDGGVVGRNNMNDNEGEDDDYLVSVRRIESFNLIKHESMRKNCRDQLIGNTNDWYEYKLIQLDNEYTINLHHINRLWTASDLIGFNNTGNICIWPSEEALTYFVLNDIDLFKNRCILELGGGMTCLAGLMLAKYSQSYLVHLTDGNSISIDNVKRSIRLNDFNCFIKCSILKWEHTHALVIPAVASAANTTESTTTPTLFTNNNCDLEYEKYDYILSADCLFFDDVRNDLIDTIWYYLSKNGTAFIMAPARGDTLKQFIQNSLKRGFDCKLFHFYDQIIWNRHLELKKLREYDENLHYPLLIKLMKK